jgi:hypothetical protein
MMLKFCCFQVKISEKATSLETAEGKITELTAKVNEQQKLIQKLEDDILKVWINDFLISCVAYSVTWSLCMLMLASVNLLCFACILTGLNLLIVLKCPLSSQMYDHSILE